MDAMMDVVVTVFTVMWYLFVSKLQLLVLCLYCVKENRLIQKSGIAHVYTTIMMMAICVKQQMDATPLLQSLGSVYS